MNSVNPVYVCLLCCEIYELLIGFYRTILLAILFHYIEILFFVSFSEIGTENTFAQKL